MSGSYRSMVSRLYRLVVWISATAMVAVWGARQMWRATAILEQADLDDDVVPDHVWDRIVAEIEQTT